MDYAYILTLLLGLAFLSIIMIILNNKDINPLSW